MKNNNKVLKRKSKKSLLSVNMVYLNISAGFGNIHIAACSIDGKTISKSSAGENGLKGSKKSTPYAGTITMNNVLEKLFKKAPNVNTAKVITKGPGAAKEAAIRAISSYITRIVHIQDITPIPHNGCTPTKPRSV